MATVTVYKMVVELDPALVVTDDQTGQNLLCNRCHLSNCEHIAKALNENLDTYIFDLKTFEVPLSLPQALWIPLALGEDLHARGVAKELKLHGSVTFANHRSLPDRNLGFLINGEGRRVVRNTVIAWIKSWALEANPLCRSRVHSSREQAIFASADAQTVLVILWNLLTTGVCPYCNTLLDQKDDLIPNPKSLSIR